MIEMTSCKNKTCSLKNNCFRYKGAKGVANRFRIGENGKCPGYIKFEHWPKEEFITHIRLFGKQKRSSRY